MIMRIAGDFPAVTTPVTDEWLFSVVAGNTTLADMAREATQRDFANILYDEAFQRTRALHAALKQERRKPN